MRSSTAEAQRSTLYANAGRLPSRNLCGNPTQSLIAIALASAVVLSSLVAGTLHSRSGKLINTPFSSGSGAGAATDANGNQITINSSGQFFDTLSGTSAVLTVAGTAPSATTYTYTSPTGSAHYTMNYTKYNIATAFVCSGIGQYTGTAYLVSSIVLPDTTQYTFTYETTTGRLKKVTLPTGGVINYAYTGGDGNGIVCSDGSTSGLTRTLSPGGAWTYARVPRFFRRPFDSLQQNL